MPPVRAFVAGFMSALFAAMLMAWQITNSFRTQDEFGIVGLALAVFAVFATLAFALTCWKGGNEFSLGLAAILLAAIAVVFAGFPRWMDAVDAYSTNPYPGAHRDPQIVLEFLMPALAVDLIIWRMTARNLLRAKGADARTRWPWFSIVLGAVLIFNPVGLDVLSSAIKQSPTDWLADLWLMVSAGGATLLLILAWTEQVVRTRMLRRSSAQTET